MECPFHRGVCLGASGWLRVGSESGCIRHRSTSHRVRTLQESIAVCCVFLSLTVKLRGGMVWSFTLCYFWLPCPNFLVSHLRKFSE